MYTNIDTEHALSAIGTYLRSHPKCKNAAAIMGALQLIMTNNIFKFDDTFWKQLTGTAMGSPPAVNCAELYFGVHELQIIILFILCLPFYGRYIDYGFGVWKHLADATADDAQWSAFQQAINNFGMLRWTFTARSSSINFLDLQITLHPNNTFTTTLYEKPMNLYQYLPPTTAHAPSVLRGFITGLVLRIFRLTTLYADQQTAVQNLFDRLLARGYTPNYLCPIFKKAFSLVKQRTTPREPLDMDSTAFLHVIHHPFGPSNALIQKAFYEHLLCPKNEPPLFEMRPSDFGRCFSVRRLIIARHRNPNLKNLLFPRKLRQFENCVPVSTTLDAIRTTRPSPADTLPLVVNPYL